jgi:hypothetical protein
MGIFDSIMDKLGFGDEENEAVETQAEESTETTDETTDEATETEEASTQPQALMSEEESAEAPEAVESVSVVDVVSRLEGLSQDHPDLDWKESIVDLLEILGIDSSYSHRKELANELGIEDYSGTAEQNIALHKTVLQKIAQNGGNLPEDLLA